MHDMPSDDDDSDIESFPELLKEIQREVQRIINESDAVDGQIDVIPINGMNPMDPDMLSQMVQGGEQPVGSTSEDEPEPHIDIRTTDEDVTFIIELPDVDPETIDLNAESDRLILSASFNGQEQTETFDLPVPVILDSSDATFANEILEVRFDRADS